VSLAVADIRPHLARCWLNQPTIFQVAHEARLVDGIQRSQSHGNGGEAPELRHEPWVRVRRESGCVTQFVPVILYLLFGDSSFKKTARVDAGRGVALEIYKISGL